MSLYELQLDPTVQMSKQICATLLAAALVAACQSVSKQQSAPSFAAPPPGVTALSSDDPVAVDHGLERQLRESPPSDAMRVLIRYLQAKLWTPSDPAKACGLWLEVTKLKQFPLARVAKLRAMETCPRQNTEAAKFALEFSASTLTAESWLTELSARSRLARAIRDQDQRAEMERSLEVAKYETLQKDQLRHLDRALTLAKNAGNAAIEDEAVNASEQAAPRLLVTPKPQQFFAVANDFKRAREFERSRDFLKKIFDGSEFNDFEKLKALDGIRMTYKLEQKNEKFIAATREYADFARAKFYVDTIKKQTHKTSADPRLGKYFETRLTLARAVWTENSAREADSLLRKMERELKGRYPLDESLFLRARIEEEAGQLSKALQLLQRIDESRLSDRSLRQKISWFRAWSLRKAGRLPEAIVQFRKLAKDDAETSTEPRDRFWLARTLKDNGEKEAALNELNWLVNNDPLGYYGMLAYRELGQPLPPLTASFSSAGRKTASVNSPPLATSGAPESSDSLFPEEQLTFDWLIATGELELGQKMLDATAGSRRGTFTDEQRLDFLKHYAAAGAYQALFGRLYELKPEIRKQILDRHPDLLFPRPFQLTVEKAATKFSIPPEIIFSIMRQESSFNPKARSIADAFGLMQLIPTAAERAGEIAGIKIKTNDDLYQPNTNIPLGAAFLRDLFAKWNERFIPAVASYNASEKAVSNWLKTRDRKDPLQFIEDIPYEETKGYVKLVMRNFVFYSRLTSEGQPVVFPEWCLNGIQDVKP